MEDIFILTKRFLNGQIDMQRYKRELLKFSEVIDGNRSGNESLSFITSAIDEIENLDSFEEDNNLRVQALLCDIFNNFAHSLKVSKTKNVYTDTLCSQMFGMKKTMVFEIIRECKRTNNKSFGIISDELQKDNMFIVDIPGCGQVKWHFPKRIDIYCQEYPFEIEDNGMNITNKNFILQEKTTSEIKKLSEHNQIVIGSLDVTEMNEELGLNIPVIEGLEQEVKEPTLEELESFDKKEDKIKDVSYEVPINE